ncbi:hypothetical protein B9J89_13190 [Vibrio sp. V15_P4S5T153]|nr:hypothetical protein B9J89_13190 [Vibrio sp. V15_P4S5T153]
MLGGRLDAEGYFAAEFTALNNSTRARNSKYVMIIYCLSALLKIVYLLQCRSVKTLIGRSVEWSYLYVKIR